MLSKEDLNYIYEWGMKTDLPYRNAPTAVGYSNQPIYYAWLKATGRAWCGVRRSAIDDQGIIDILNDPDILFATGACFTPGTELGPHKDPNVYRQPYSRIQIPLVVDPHKCYMVWKGEKRYWESGVIEQYDVMDHVHEGYNFSNQDMEFIFIDVKKK